MSSNQTQNERCYTWCWVLHFHCYFEIFSYKIFPFSLPVGISSVPHLKMKQNLYWQFIAISYLEKLLLNFNTYVTSHTNNGQVNSGTCKTFDRCEIKVLYY